ncbi:MAG: response regulator [Pirellulales bacterium]|nr:response regulator [Pirellulales bacterium]
MFSYTPGASAESVPIAVCDGPREYEFRNEGNIQVKSKESNKLGIATTVAAVLLLFGGVFALYHAQSIRLLAATHAGLDVELRTGLASLADAELKQYGKTHEFLVVGAPKNPEMQATATETGGSILELSERVSEGCSQLSRVAHEASDEHEAYEALVEDLMNAASFNQTLTEMVQTLERLRREGRIADATKFAGDIAQQADRLRIADVENRFFTAVVDRTAASHERQRATMWWFLGCFTAALALWTLYFRLRLRQTRVELARSRVVKAQRAEHLRVARSQAGQNDEDELGENADGPLSGCRVLTAEDGPHNRRFIKRVLVSAGAQVTFAEDGEKAVDMTFAASKANEPYDVVLMDMQMPVMDGMEATKTLRRFHYQGPVVAVSADSQPDDREQCLNAGCDAYVEKPLDRDALLAAIERFFAASCDRKAETALVTSS